MCLQERTHKCEQNAHQGDAGTKLWALGHAHLAASVGQMHQVRNVMHHNTIT